MNTERPVTSMARDAKAEANSEKAEGGPVQKVPGPVTMQGPGQQDFRVRKGQACRPYTREGTPRTTPIAAGRALGTS